MKKKYFLLLLALLPFIYGCNNEDDIGEIFSGAWKLNNFYLTSDWKDDDERIPVYNPANTEDRKILDQINQPGKFTINFSENEFTGVPDNGVFSGTWQANGKNNTVYINIKSGGSSADAIGKKYLDALRNVRYYSGDSNYLRLYPEDRSSYIQFQRSR